MKRAPMLALLAVLVFVGRELTVGRTVAAHEGAADTLNAKLFHYERAPEYGVTVIEDVMVPMGDGVKLATDIYFPTKNGQLASGKFPAILDRTPYDKVPRAQGINNPWYFAQRGYVFVFQDSRGHGNSEGEFHIYINEGRDGYDAVEWIAKQPWSNGKVGTSGYSYDAATQNSLARENPPHLSAMFVGYGTANYHDDCAGVNGAFGLSHNLIYTIGHAMRDRRARENANIMAKLRDAQDNQLEWMRKPLSKHFQLFEEVPMARQWYMDWVNHPDYDDYWKQNGYNSEGFYDRYPDIPIYFMGGWYDFFVLGTIRNYEGLSKIHNSPTLLTVVGSSHGPSRAASPIQNDVDMGPEGPVIWDEMRLQFFDQTLMGLDTGVFEQPKVKLFVMGGGDGSKTLEGHFAHGGTWRTFDAWPPPPASMVNYYLQAGGGLSTATPPANAKPSAYIYDPEDPVLQLGGNYATPSGWGPRDQRCSTDIWPCTDDLPLSARADVQVFQTEPLAQDVEVAGPLTVKLWASSSAVDTDFTVKLVDQYPPSEDYPHGYSIILADSIIRGRYRNSEERAEPMEPGQVYEFTIDLWSTANRFQKGHRIRLDVSSSNFPRFDPNPNTGEPIGYHTRTEKAHNTVYHDQQRASSLILPILSETSQVTSGGQ